MRLKYLLLSLLSVCYLSACDSDTGNASNNDVNLEINNSDLNSANDVPSITWRRCDDGSRLECGTLEVPLDYSAISGATLALDVKRLKAANADQRIGVLIINPGGPGVSGAQFVADYALGDGIALPQIIRERFDIVGFDPRGIQNSGQISCDFGQQDPFSHYPGNIVELAEVAAEFDQHAFNCRLKYGSNYLSKFGSNNVVRDMEQLRQALGERQINYLGYSYGTRIGALYAKNYPDEIRTLILDAAMHPSKSIPDYTEDFINAYQANLEQLSIICTNNYVNCPVPFIPNLQASMDFLDSTRQESDLGLLATGIIETIRDLSDFDRSIAELTQVIQTPGAVLNTIVESVNAEPPRQEVIDSVTSIRAVLCMDESERPSVESIEAKRELYHVSSNLFSEALMDTALTCYGWPETNDPITAIVNADIGTGLVIGGTNDTQTPYVWSQAMSIGLGAQLLTSGHMGHGVFLQNKSDCVDNAVLSYLESGELLEVGQNCPLELK